MGAPPARGTAGGRLKILDLTGWPSEHHAPQLLDDGGAMLGGRVGGKRPDDLVRERLPVPDRR
jgi:hypothetical protein